MVRMKRSALAFAFGARTAALIWMPSLAKTAPKSRVELAVAVADQEVNHPGRSWSVQANWRRLLRDP
jgi:hypothetical protein